MEAPTRGVVLIEEFSVAWTAVAFDSFSAEEAVVSANAGVSPDFRDAVVERDFFDERKNLSRPCNIMVGVGTGERRCRKFSVRVGVIEHPEHALFEVVRALHSSCGFASRLNGRKKQSDQDSDDCDDDEKLYQGEPPGLARCLFHDCSSDTVREVKSSNSMERITLTVWNYKF